MKRYREQKQLLGEASFTELQVARTEEAQIVGYWIGRGEAVTDNSG